MRRFFQVSYRVAETEESRFQSSPSQSFAKFDRSNPATLGCHLYYIDRIPIRRRARRTLGNVFTCSNCTIIDMLMTTANIRALQRDKEFPLRYCALRHASCATYSLVTRATALCMPWKMKTENFPGVSRFLVVEFSCEESRFRRAKSLLPSFQTANAHFLLIINPRPMWSSSDIYGDFISYVRYE